MKAYHALLMVDIVDSTAITERLGSDRASSTWAEHDRVVRALLRSKGGQEIDKTDGFLAAFEDVGQAAACAIEYHRALRRLDVPVLARAALHSARVEVQRTALEDVAHGAKPVEVTDWLAKAVTARALSVAGGGRTLLTSEAARGLADAQFRLFRHGHWRFRGLSEPMEIFELLDDDVGPAPPSSASKAYQVVERNGVWIPSRDVRHSLPAERDDFIGRDAALAAVAQKFRDGTRLLSIVGVGGVGKTRLALRYGWQWLGDFPGGAWFCDLSAAQTSDGVLYAVAKGLDLPLSAGDPIEQIAVALAGREASLVILDNFEQVAEYAEATVGRWLERAPAARFLITTRETLGIAGEMCVEADPLDPEESERLFLSRTRGAGCGDPPAHERAAIKKLVAMLDGLPLAIELAAARTRVMSPSTMLDRIADRFGLLTSRQGRKPRQATLRAALDWSWDLLPADEKQALAECSMFEGGFTLTDAFAVLEPRGPSAIATDDLLQSLVEKSLVRRQPWGRLQLLQSVREYAAERLNSPGSFPGSGPAARSGAEARHSGHFSGLDEDAATKDRCAAADDLVAACRRAILANSADFAVGALEGSWFVLCLRGPFRIALQLAQQVLGLNGLSDQQRSVALRILGRAQELLGQMDLAHRSLQDALELARRSGDFESEGWALCALGEHRYKSGITAQARELLDGAMQIAEEHAIKRLQCSVCNSIGTLETRLGHADEARASYESALGIARDLKDVRREGGLLGNLAIVAHDAGQWDVAQSQYEEALTLAKQVGDLRWEGNTRCNLGLLLQERGNTTSAEDQFREALTLARELGHQMLEATVLCNLGISVFASGKWRESRAHHQRAANIASALGDRRAEGQFRGYLAESLVAGDDFTSAAREFALAEAALREVQDNASLSIVLCLKAQAQDRAGDRRAAAETARQASSLAPKSPPMDLQRALAVLRHLIEEPS